MAKDEGDELSHILYAGARVGVFRVQSELWPLQATGKSVSDSEWHSTVQFIQTSIAKTITVTLRRRKNERTAFAKMTLCCAFIA